MSLEYNPWVDEVNDQNDNHDQILLNFVGRHIANQLLNKDPILWGEMQDKAMADYRQAVKDGEIPVI